MFSFLPRDERARRYPQVLDGEWELLCVEKPVAAEHAEGRGQLLFQKGDGRDCTSWV